MKTSINIACCITTRSLYYCYKGLYLRYRVIMRDLIGLRFAINGLRQFFKTERNGRIQGVSGVVAILTGIIFRISLNEWMVLLLCVGGVLGLEILNSAIEKLCNLITTDYHPQIKLVKDLSAGAVLMMCIISVIIGCIIFIPKLLHLY